MSRMQYIFVLLGYSCISNMHAANVIGNDNLLAGKEVPNRALEVGCSVGQSSFEMAQGFSEVVGLDYSWAFVNKCQELKTTGQAGYFLRTEGTLKEKRMACIDTSIVSHRHDCVLHNTG